MIQTQLSINLLQNSGFKNMDNIPYELLERLFSKMTVAEYVDLYREKIE